ncbi:MAG: hypothetical protein RSJ40_04670 [Acetivibrio sp.]
MKKNILKSMLRMLFIIAACVLVGGITYQVKKAEATSVGSTQVQSEAAVEAVNASSVQGKDDSVGLFIFMAAIILLVIIIAAVIASIVSVTSAAVAYKSEEEED